MSFCFPPAGLSFGFTSAGGVSFAELAKTSGEFAFAKKGESVYLCSHVFPTLPV